MPNKPVIIVQLVHIEGPFKGKIEEYSDSVIRIGRNVDCQICFPKDTTIVSRNHAEIVREGNRFKLIDHSTNGTFVSGKTITETFLKGGDVIMIGEGGPKISFLTEIKTADTGSSGAFPSSKLDKTLAEGTFSPSVFSQSPSAQERPPGNQPPERPAVPPEPVLFSSATREPTPVAVSEQKRAPESMEMKVRASLVIQLGPTIRSFQQLPVIVGKNNDCDFIINHVDIIDRHIQFSFYENNYWVNDLTGQGLITINDTPIQAQTPLHPGSQLSLGPRGPAFQFLSGGRLVEVTDQSTEEDSQESPDALKTPWHATPVPQRRGKDWLIFFVVFLIILIAVIAWLFFNPGRMDETMAGGLKAWWYRLVEAIQRIVG